MNLFYFTRVHCEDVPKRQLMYLIGFDGKKNTLHLFVFVLLLSLVLTLIFYLLMVFFIFRKNNIQVQESQDSYLSRIDTIEHAQYFKEAINTQ